MTRRTVNGEPVILGMFANNYDSAPPAVTAGQPVAEVANESASKTVASTAYDAKLGGRGFKKTESRRARKLSLAKKNRKGLQILQYPKDLGISSEHAHYMRFSTYNIGGTMGASGSDNSFTETGNHVFLPIPGNPSASYEQGWETEEYGITGSALATGADAVMDAYSSTTSRPGGAPEASLTEIAGAMTAAGKKIIGNAFKERLDRRVLLGDVGNVFSNRALTQSQGDAVFDQSFAVYGGPAYRTFSFQFSLMPLSRDDTDKIKEIVNFFKINAAPTQAGANLVRIYGLPKAFEIKYFNRTQENDYMNRIGKCALTSFNVSYGGERFTTFENTNAPVQVDIALAFKELQLQDSKSMGEGY